VWTIVMIIQRECNASARTYQVNAEKKAEKGLV